MSERTTSRRKTTKARERYEARKRRREGQATHPDSSPRSSTSTPPRPNRAALDRAVIDRAAPDQTRRLPQVSLDGIRQIDWMEEAKHLHRKLSHTVADLWWYARRNRQVWFIAAGLAVLVAVMMMVTSVFGTDVPRGVTVQGVALGGLSHDEALEKLRDWWEIEVEIKLLIEDHEAVTLSPDDLGIEIDIAQTVALAESVGLKAFPFGASVEPVLSIDFITAQNTLLDLAEEVNTRPTNAHYTYENGQVIGIPGKEGFQLDTTSTINDITQNLNQVVAKGEADVWLNSLRPDVRDPEPYLEQITEMVSQPFELRGFDPYSNQFFTWPIQPETLVTWIEAGPLGLRINESRFNTYMQLLNETLNTDGTNQRYLAPSETVTFINEALLSQQPSIDLRVRHRPSVYAVEPGDRGFSIARRTGMPFYLIEEANSGRDMNFLFAGDVLNIPSPDDVMPEDPIPNKRIVVDLTYRYLMAFENGQVVFEWPISIGVENAPTSPGVYQILSHSEKAYGSSNTLCDAAGLVCGQWEMNWFMGIYEVVPGLFNGFHGSVLLPNGNLLGDGAVGYQNTFGCVMSPDDNARALYDWAEIGTTVEIISEEYAPTSDLGRYVRQQLDGTST